MTTKSRFSRREFVQSLGYVSAAGAWSAFVPKAKAITGTKSAVEFAYVGSTPGSSRGDNHGIHVFAVKDGYWERIQSLGSRAPSFLTLHPNQQVLYVANSIEEHQGLPCGTVESYAVDAKSGTLQLLQRHQLSLSGTKPGQLAVSPDGKHLVVALYGGGAYNFLALDKEGVPGRVTGIVKEVGSGPHASHQASAHPNGLLFDPWSHHLLSTDLGCDRFNVFRIEEGKFQRNQQFSIPAGRGPGRLALHPSGKMLYFANELDGSLSSYRYASSPGELGEQLQHIAPAAGADDAAAPLLSSLIVHPSGRFLYSSFLAPQSGLSSGIKVWEIESSLGKLSYSHSFGEGSISPRTFTMTDAGDGLYVLDPVRSSIVYVAIDPVEGNLDSVTPVARVDAPASLALRYR